MNKKLKRRRVQTQSIEERMAFKIQDAHKCSLGEAWDKLKLFRLEREMSRIPMKIGEMSVVLEYISL